MSEEKFGKETQKKLRGVSKAIYILTKIAKIFITIAFVCMILGIIGITIFLSVVETKNNVITFKGSDEHFTLVRDKNDINKMAIRYKDTLVADGIDQNSMTNIVKLLEANNRTKLIVCAEIGMLCSLATIFIYRMLLVRLEKLFKNISTGDTPFTVDNAKLIKQMAFLMIYSIIASVVAAIPFGFISNLNYNYNMRGFSVIEILILFAVSYIFEYGAKLQEGSNEKVYSELEGK